MIRNYVIAIFTLMAVAGKAQTYGNEWINYAQKYFKIPVYKEAVYRIDSAALAQRFDLANTDPRNFQLFIRGKEQFIFVSGESDGKINTGDYVEFYAKPEIREIDSLIYTGIAYVPNPYLGLYNDTVTAFLTLNTSITNKRFSLETDTASAPYPAPDHFFTERLHAQIFPWNYNAVGEHLERSSDPRYTQAEGKGTQFGNGAGVQSNFHVLNVYTGSPQEAIVTVQYSGRSRSFNLNPDHHVKIFYNDQGNNITELHDTVFHGCKAIKRQFKLSTSGLSSAGNFTLFSTPDALFTVNDNVNILHFLSLFYPQTLNLGNQSTYKLYIDNSVSAGKNFFNLAGFNHGGNPVLFYDLSNGKRITTVTNGANVRVVVPDGPGRKLCYMSAQSEVVNVQTITAAGTDGTFTDYRVPVTKTPYLLIYGKKLESSALEYKTYRQSAAGGNFHVIAADAKELYEQFCYGVNKHPAGIRNFIRFMNDTLSVKPSNVLLIGKGAKRGDGGALEVNNIIPSFGIPSSDNLYTSSLATSSPDNFYPDIPIGRIPTINNADVITYLNKVKEHDATPLAEWKKRVLHFVGGHDEQLLVTLSVYMNEYKDIISDTLFGAEVLTFKKNTVAPIQTVIGDSIRRSINEGASLLTFFGHGHQAGFDQSIDEPEFYDNAGRYPFLLANSCLSGDIHDQGVISVSERFTFAKQKGSIAFLATTSDGFQYALYFYSRHIYQELSGRSYGKSMGEVIKHAAFENSQSGDMIRKFVNMDMALNGDPAIVLTVGEKPDYRIRNSDVKFDLATHKDSLGINLSMKNLAKAIDDSFYVRIERFFPNGDSALIMKKVQAPYYKSELKLNTPIDFDRGIGLNKFRIRIDHYNEIAELDENNNSTLGTVDLFVPGGDVYPVYPFNYAVVPKTQSITLKASTTDPFAPETTYRFQLDTSDKFTKPIQTGLITSKGGVVEWQVNLPLPDSTVYYWRVSRDSSSSSLSFAWRNSSFQTVGNKRGWSQAHFFQFRNNQYQFVNYNEPARQFRFRNNTHLVECRTGNNPHVSLPNQSYYFDNLKMDDWSCTFDGWNFAVFDSISGQPQKVQSVNYPNAGPGQYNNCVCKPNQTFLVYNFGNWAECGAMPTWKTDVENFLNAVAPNNYVLAYSTGLSGSRFLSSYPNSMFDAFETIGAKNIRTLGDNIPYILFGRKGMMAGQGHESIGTSSSSAVYLSDTVTSHWKDGHIVSEKIGPSSKWNSLHWRVKSLDAGPGDSTILKIVGVKASGAVDTLLAVTEDSLDVLNLDQFADAGIYPFMKLIAFMKDNIHRTPPQMSRWQVMYDEAPECAINPIKGFAAFNDTLLEGDQVMFRFPIENVGYSSFKDSLIVTYWIIDNAGNKTDLHEQAKPGPFESGQVIFDTVKINSYQLQGSNALWIFVNPITNKRYQYEQHQFNNIARYAFQVNRDQTNPLMDVTFDGVRILNGDIVSAWPEIMVTLRDENKFLALNDTSAFTVLLKEPGKATPKRIWFAQGLKFTPASLPNNSCKIYYHPYFAADGRYTLIVQATDRSNNRSGAEDYRIDFEVVNKPTVTNVMNYPNPFSTATRFVFTLTGSQVPEVFTIQIMTITGKVVREITRSELGHLHIGRNITDYAWDGRDMYGDRLGNGVYLYRVMTKLNGEDIEKNASGADKFFTKEFGKMVLMR